MPKLSLRIVLALAVCGAVSLARAGDSADLPLLRLPEFSLDDYRGKEHSSADFQDAQAVVLVFMGTECPLAKLYAPRLEKLHQQFQARGVALLGINANVQDSLTEIASYARVHGLTFPILKDAGNRLANELGAERTPEVFLFDATRTLRYRGRIDDQYGVGYVRDEPQRRDLAEALDQLLAGKAITTPLTEAVGCYIGRVKEPAADADVTYSNQISRLLNRRCVECHRDGEIAPFALTDYHEVAGWAEMIAEVVEQQRMPPWHASPEHGHFKNERLLSDEEKQLIYRWVKLGAPEGDKADLPDPPQFTSGWQLPREPDAEFYITEEPFEVQAEGEVKYKWFSVDPGFTEDKWLAAAEIVPGNRAVVHHVLAFAHTPGSNARGDGADGYLVGYVPGLLAAPFPTGMAKRIPAGSQLVFQVHYTPIGTVQHDHTKIGLIFADSDDVTHEVKTIAARSRNLLIPAGAENHEVTANSQRTPQDMLLLAMMPHMHLRGKSFRYEAKYADGTSEVLLDVPKYDFNWQTAYRLAEPKTLPSGTSVRATAHFDNSEQNLSNPDPTVDVRWGDQTWEEMMIGYCDVAVPRSEADEKSPGMPNLKEELIRRLLAERGNDGVRAKRLITLLDRDGNGQLGRDEIDSRLLDAFDKVDTNRDESVTLEELSKAMKATRR